MNKTTYLNGAILIKLSGNKKGYAILDACVYESNHIIQMYSWANCNGYAKAGIDAKSVFLHRLIMGNPEGHVHHINGNTFDNRKSNLTVMTASNHITHHTKGVRIDRVKLLTFDKPLDKHSWYKKAA